MNLTEIKEIYDISPLISHETAVFPGDKAFERHVAMAYDRGDSFELSSISTTLHVGAHVDSFSHYKNGGEAIDKQPLERFMGPCQVVNVQLEAPRRIMVDDIKSVKIAQARVLLKTGTFPNPYEWRADFASLSVELIEYFQSHGVTLIGIDTPSVDPSDCKNLEAHHRLHDFGISNLEGVVLNNIVSGEYMLHCLPLNLKGCEASPVRAVLYK